MPLCPVERPLESFAKAIRPPDELKVSDWARKYFRTSSDYGPIVGEFVPHPYQVEPLDALSSSDATEIMVLMCAAQMMKTLIMLVFLGYVIDHDPGPVLIVQPTGEDAESFSTERIRAMIQDVPVVAQKMSRAAAEGKGRTSGNKILQKSFRGGQVSLTGAISDSGLRRRSVRYLLLDEVDAEGYSATRNGDRIARAIMRTATYWNRKIVLCSTPSLEGSSRIAEWYLQGDQRQFFVPCPFPSCGHEQVLVWERVKWGQIEGREEPIPPGEAHYQCARCNALIPHHRKTEMLRAGRWIAQNPGARYRSYQISRLYAPDWSWGRVAVEVWLPAKGNPEALKQFRNEVLAETWKDKGEAPEWERLIERQEPHSPGKVPAGAMFLTAGADVQRDRIEVEIVGWGRNRESWSIDYRILEGRTSEPEVWQKLSGLLAETFPHESGAVLPIARLFVDSGDGTTTNDVYTWARSQDPERAWAIKGFEKSRMPVGQPSPVDVTIDGKKHENGLKIKVVQPGFFKSEFYAFLKLRPPTPEEKQKGLSYPPGYCHFPTGKNYGDEHFKQLCSEQLVTRKNRKTGRLRTEWEQTRDRNEALDCRVYARAAAWDYGLDQAQEIHWQQIEQQLKPAEQQPQVPQPKPREREPWIPRKNWFR